jgi:transposase-like protein
MGKYKCHTASVKAKVALEAASNQKPVNQIASEFEVAPSQVTEWKTQLLMELENFFQEENDVKR